MTSGILIGACSTWKPFGGGAFMIGGGGSSVFGGGGSSFFTLTKSIFSAFGFSIFSDACNVPYTAPLMTITWKIVLVVRLPMLLWRFAFDSMSWSNIVRLETVGVRKTPSFRAITYAHTITPEYEPD